MRSGCKEPSRNKAEAYRVYGEHLFRRSDAADALRCAKANDIINYRDNTHVITDYRYDSFGRRTHTVERTKWGMRTIYDGLTFEVVKEGETTPDSRGITTTGSGDANLYNYNPHGSEHTRGTRYYYISEREHELRTDKNGEALPDRTKGVRTYLYLNGERVAVNNLYNTNHGQYYYGSDILGSVKFVTGQGGQELKRIEYDVFGGIYKGNSPYGLETGYTGKPYDAVTGLSDYGFRDYSPTHARFITEDPIRDGENWFAYVGNNPVNWVDPWGLSASDGKVSENKYEGDLKKTRIRYMQWTPAEGEGVLGSYIFDVYTSIKKDTDVYKLDVWVIAVSGPHIRHDDTKYYGTVTLNVDGQQRESKPLQSPKESFLIESTSVMVGEANFQFPQQSNTSVTIKNTGYIYSNPEGYQLSWPSADTKIDIKE